MKGRDAGSGVFVDTHAHFDLCVEEGASEESLTASLRDAGVAHAVQVSIDTGGLAWSLDFARRNRGMNVVFTAGIHPSSPASGNNLEELASFVSMTLCSPDADLLFGIGETGLDYYRLRRPADEQRRSFEFQIDLAARHGLPLIVHSRDAYDDTMEILKRKRPSSGIMHCFAGGRERAREYLDLGFYISFAGNLTYSKAADLHEAASYVPLDRLLLETDAPFLTPVPHRGTKNRPDYVAHTYAFVAKLRGENISTIQDSVLESYLSIRRTGGR